MAVYSDEAYRMALIAATVDRRSEDQMTSEDSVDWAHELVCEAQRVLDEEQDRINRR